MSSTAANIHKVKTDARVESNTAEVLQVDGGGSPLLDLPVAPLVEHHIDARCEDLIIHT